MAYSMLRGGDLPFSCVLFVEQPHCNHKTCGRCSLYSNTEEDDQRAMREAGVKAAAAQEDVSIDVNEILQNTKLPPPMKM